MKKYILLTISALAALTFTGCDDFLTEEPTTSQSDVLTLNTAEGIADAVIGAYSPLNSSAWYGAAYILNTEMMTSDGRRYPGTSHDSGRYTEAYALNWTPNSTYAGLWSGAYYVIASVNSVLTHIDAVSGLDEATKNNYKAECLFLRALSYFDLVNVYALPKGSASTSQTKDLGVPIVLTPDLTAKPARNTVDEVYTQIFADLDQAESLMDPSYQRSGTDPKGFASIYAIYALHSRAALYHQDWQVAADYATKVIESKKFSLWSAKELPEAYTQDLGGKEVIFEVYDSRNNSYNPYHDSVCNLTSPKGEYGDCGVSSDLYNLYEAADARKALIGTFSDGAYATLKYAGKGVGTPDANNIIVFRLSEMYLNRAEAVINGASGSSAVSDLSAIANARGASVQPATLSGVYLERRKELAWEGHLWFDLSRTGRDMTRTDVAGTAIPSSLPASSYKWAFPIPVREFNVNPNLRQNDGYSEN